MSNKITVDDIDEFVDLIVKLTEKGVAFISHVGCGEHSITITGY